MDKDLAAKAEAKMAEVGGGMEAEARAWIEAVTGTALGGMSLQEELKDGTVLCTLANKISDGCCKPSSSKMPFKQMENIAAYLEACTALGVPQNDLFQTVALFENKDMIAVLTNIHSLGRVSQKVEGFAGPYLGAKLASTNRRSFTEEQLAAGLNAATFLGKGSHGCVAARHATRKEIVKGARRPRGPRRERRPRRPDDAPAPSDHLMGLSERCDDGRVVFGRGGRGVGGVGVRVLLLAALLGTHSARTRTCYLR